MEGLAREAMHVKDGGCFLCLSAAEVRESDIKEMGEEAGHGAWAWASFRPVRMPLWLSEGMSTVAS